ncbi:hypothetical protein F511_29645 [Dorcoceras hygrometricum]|uniref:Uncharacterized protein n=1 Tax=Dorcoceras hygrometricum TaxID=472368 RepID=A0A2Z7D513_9LAMI|nr:hypothetical protein F511_29645 [Dorcoceras hygrometricum]
MLSEYHHIALLNLLEQLRLHKLKWKRPSSSILFGGADLQSGGIHSQFYPSIVSSSWSTIVTESIAQLRASIDNIQFKQVQTRESVDDLKAELSKKITRLEIALAQSTSRKDMVFRALINDVQQRSLLLFVLNFQKSLPISIEGVKTKMGKRVVVVRILKIEEDREVVEEAAVNHQRKEVDLTKEEEAEAQFRSQQQRKLILFVERDFRSDEDFDKERKREESVKEKGLEAYIV